MSRAAAIVLTLAVAISATTWLFAADRRGALPADFDAFERPALVVGKAERAEALVRAAIRLATPLPPAASPTFLTCQFLSEPPNGTTPKFHCALPDGEIIKVKYGRNPEIQSEAAASRLLARLNYAVDAVSIVPMVRCYGCPRFPYTAMRLRGLPIVDRFLPERYDNGYTDFEQVAVEHKFIAPAIETEALKGWSWFELKDSQAARADVDAFRLLAVFLAHWDNKAENQRLVCLSGDSPCSSPLLMIQDLGAVFGPYKANLAAWQRAAIWDNAAECRLSMRTLPFGGSTFPDDVQISEEGRQRLLADLAALTDADLREVFTAGAFGSYYAGTDDERDLQAWTAAFRQRADTIAAAGPCPAASPSRPSPDSSSQS